MGDCYDLVLLRFKGRFDLVQRDNASDIGSQRIYLCAVRLQARVEELVFVRKIRLSDVNAPIGERVTEITSVQNQSIFTRLDQVRSDLQDIKLRSTFE